MRNGRIADGRCLDELLSSSWLYRSVVFSAVNVASWHVARYNVCFVRAADRRQLFRCCDRRVRCCSSCSAACTRANTPCRSIQYAACRTHHPTCRADDRPRYNNTAATPAALMLLDDRWQTFHLSFSCAWEHPHRVLDSRVCRLRSPSRRTRTRGHIIPSQDCPI